MEQARADLATAAEQGCALAELRLDCFEALPDPGELVPHSPLPLLVTCRPEREGGGWAGREADRLELLAGWAAAGAAAIDVERDAADALPALPSETVVVVSHHPAAELLAEEAEEALAAVAHGRADALKLAAPVSDSVAGLALLRAGERRPEPCLAIGIGEAGAVTRLAGTLYGAPWVYAAPDEQRSTASGQLSCQALAELWGARTPGPGSGLYGVVGQPVGHSRSPWLMNRAFAALGEDAVYSWLPTADPVQLLKDAEQDPRLRGLSVTLPYKETLVRWGRGQPRFVAGPEVDATRALNTLVRRAGSAEWRALNTDALAAHELFTARLRAGDLAARARVAVLGSGGSARALAWAAREAGLEVTAFGRHPQRGQALAHDLAVAYGGPLEELPVGPGSPGLIAN